MNWVVKSEDRVTTGHRRLLLCAEHTDALLLQSTLYSIFLLLLFHFPAKKIALASPPTWQTLALFR